MSGVTTGRQESGTQPEDLFGGLFAEVFGLEKACLLVPQHPVEDIDGNTRYIDFALRTVAERIAFEIDGLTWHVPDPDRIRNYEDALLRQNSLVRDGWRVFRWTDRQVADEPERVKEPLALFLERILGLLEFDEFLPRQRGQIRERFLAFVTQMDMFASYKPVMLRALLDLVDETGRAKLDAVARAFHDFYRDRLHAASDTVLQPPALYPGNDDSRFRFDACRPLEHGPRTAGRNSIDHRGGKQAELFRQPGE